MFIFFVLFDKRQLEVDVINFRIMNQTIVSQFGHVFLQSSLFWSFINRMVNSTSILREGPIRKASHNSGTCSIFLKVVHIIKIDSIIVSEGHFSDTRSIIYTSLYFESGGSSICRSFSSVKKK